MRATAITLTGLPLALGAAGEAVRDLQRRLTALGIEAGRDQPGDYGPGTEDAVRRFQATRGLQEDGVCGPQTWSALVEAGYRLGDRLLYLRAPMLRGDDVAELQVALGALGFDAGRVDGIFGPRTATALGDFQRNAGLPSDAISGPDTLASLARLGGRTAGPTPVAHLREREALRRAPRRLQGRRVAVGETGGLGALVDGVGRVLHEAGAVVAVLHHPDGSAQAGEANDFGAEAFLGVSLSDRGPACQAAYYAAPGFESVGGRRLAALVSEAVAGALGCSSTTHGMRVPILRETRMPAVVCTLAPAELVVERSADLGRALSRSLAQWTEAPVEP